MQDAEIAQISNALQKQVTQHFAPIWGIDAELTVVPKDGAPAPGSWWLVVLDKSDQAGALGYHDMTSEGLPSGKVFAQSDMETNSSVSVTMSHELLEMLADPWISMCAEVDMPKRKAQIVAWEVCDAPEDDALGYPIDGVMVSDFVTPYWFNTTPPANVKFDYMGHIKRPLQILKGGYIGVLNLTGNKGWSQINAQYDEHDEANDAHPGSRRERRNTPRHRRRHSTAHK
jgi:hypothetical protein